jgi:hypothetical protein
MARNTDLSAVLFPVELKPVGYTVRAAGHAEAEGELEAPVGRADFKGIPQYKAVVRGDTGKVLAVVSDRYQLLHNSRALEMGKTAFTHLFPAAKASDFIVFDVQTTETGSACHVDLIHNSYSTEVWEQETWLPFLRVSNSYNRYRALSFDFGFVRRLCSNGMIFRKESIKARFYHTKGRLEVNLSQDATFSKLKEMESEFSAHMKGLHAITVKEQLLLPLSIYFLGLDFEIDARDPVKQEREKERLAKVVVSLSDLIRKYLKELGANAYSALNVATDFATHTPRVAGAFATSATLQNEVGQRTRHFLGKIGDGQEAGLELFLKDQILLAK